MDCCSKYVEGVVATSTSAGGGHAPGGGIFLSTGGNLGWLPGPGFIPQAQISTGSQVIDAALGFQFYINTGAAVTYFLPDVNGLFQYGIYYTFVNAGTGNIDVKTSTGAHVGFVVPASRDNFTYISGTDNSAGCWIGI